LLRPLKHQQWQSFLAAGADLETNYFLICRVLPMWKQRTYVHKHVHTYVPTGQTYIAPRDITLKQRALDVKRRIHCSKSCSIVTQFNNLFNYYDFILGREESD
jgi:hypothetical protein